MLVDMEIRHWAIWYTAEAPAGAPPSVSAHQVGDHLDGYGRVLAWFWRRGDQVRPVWEVRAEHVVAYRDYDTPIAAHVATLADPPPDATPPPEPLPAD